MNQHRRGRIVLAWVCFGGSILLLVANLTGVFQMRAAIPVAMMLLVLGIMMSASVKKDGP